MVELSKRSLKSPSNREYLDPRLAKEQLLTRASDYERYARNLLDLLPTKQGKLLDVGCGLGWIVKEAKNRGFAASGIDPAAPYVRLGKKYLGVNLKITSLKNFTTKEKFNVIILNHVLEHVKNPKPFLQKIRHLLALNGLVLVACPNMASLMAFLFGKRWYGLVPSQHHWQFTASSLPKLIAEQRFKIKHVVINNLDYQVPGIKGVIFTLLLFAANLLSWGDQVIVLAQKK